ncbi:Hypothetical protein ORPV_1047 [Orpheovirus IHUMI-LCC2]|uniref:Uncharacterized protein n=1 Tax=Orpheovirus IHUMI-LCC2 TaxID=2023057 RepID=A0A2I2L607_9VIRU|nr:Hypothetical protein ORPV_1047 [Orpheovirus IHUMI-LCC2]SNW62951.1 Hypothetical protein ORPV_1047 [Orpheovirus IHUMI-LCC2]
MSESCEKKCTKLINSIDFKDCLDKNKFTVLACRGTSTSNANGTTVTTPSFKSDIPSSSADKGIRNRFQYLAYQKCPTELDCRAETVFDFKVSGSQRIDVCKIPENVLCRIRNVKEDPRLAHAYVGLYDKENSLFLGFMLTNQGIWGVYERLPVCGWAPCLVDECGNIVQETPVNIRDLYLDWLRTVNFETWSKFYCYRRWVLYLQQEAASQLDCLLYDCDAFEKWKKKCGDCCFSALDYNNWKVNESQDVGEEFYYDAYIRFGSGCCDKDHKSSHAAYFSDAFLLARRATCGNPADDLVTLAISINPSKKSVKWWIAGNPVKEVVRPGIRTQEQNRVVEYGGADSELCIKSVRFFYGTGAALDWGLPNNYDRAYVDCGYLARSQLSQYLPINKYANLYYNPRGNLVKADCDTFVNSGQDCSCYNYNQGATVTVRCLRVYEIVIKKEKGCSKSCDPCEDSCEDSCVPENSWCDPTDCPESSTSESSECFNNRGNYSEGIATDVTNYGY